VARLKRDHPIADVVAAAGVALRPSGRALVGRCPLHDDRGRPNLHVYADTASYYCYRCALGGDVIDFLMRAEGLGFVQACARLGGSPAHRRAGDPVSVAYLGRPPGPPPEGLLGRDGRVARGRIWERLDLAEQAAMNGALAVYRRGLWASPGALAYVRGRGLPDRVIRECALGFADGLALEAYARRHGLLEAAERLGLLRPASGRGRRPAAGGPLRETFAGRIVVPELRCGQAVWFIGRDVRATSDRPRYLALGGERPVLGYERAAGRPEALLCEGVFDYLTAVGWRLPAWSPCGTHLPPERLGFLATARAIYGALDGDAAGQAAAARFGAWLGPRFRPLVLPEGCDLNDLGRRPGGRATFFALLAAARRRPAAPGGAPRGGGGGRAPAR
jgi:DNA primase